MGNTKKQNLIQTGIDLFLRHGIRRITVEEICEKAHVSKMTFYKYFRNKNDLVKTILQQMMDTAMQQYHEIMSSSIPFPEKAKRMIDLKMRATKGFGKAFYSEIMSMRNPDLIEMFGRSRQKNLQTIISDLIAAQRQGDIRPEINPEFISYLMDHLIEMAEDPRINQIFDTPQAIINELTNFFFYGILARTQSGQLE